MKKTLYWCPECNVPLLGQGCAAGHEGRPIALLEPYDVRPALAADHELVASLVRDRFGPVRIPRVLLLNKTGGTDRNELVIANGERFGWLTFDPVERCHRFEPEPAALPALVGAATGAWSTSTRTRPSPAPRSGSAESGSTSRLQSPTAR